MEGEIKMTVMTDRIKTKEFLIKWIGNTLCENNIPPYYASAKLEEVFGIKIHTHISNFIEFAKDNNLDDIDISTTLAHDVSGALNNDKLIIPRVGGY